MYVLQRNKLTRQFYATSSPNPLQSDLSIHLFIMSTQFIKWWKAKFQSTTTCGYKNITVLGSDGYDGKSDLEELVRDDTSSAYTLHGAHINPALTESSLCSDSEMPNKRHSASSESQVRLEDFKCDVRVEDNQPGEARKEFSFTFYDLDGHGKITKDDIAGLVKSIYGAVNNSITVPHGGKKTIQVRLTVTPEKKSRNRIDCSCKGTSPNNDCRHHSSPETQNNNNNNNNNNNAKTIDDSPPEPAVIHLRHKFRNNVIIQENLKAERRFRHGDKLKFSSVRIPTHLTGCRGCRNLSPEVARDCSASPMRHRKKWRERSCHHGHNNQQHQHQQSQKLIDLLQANMEQNNVSPCCRQAHSGGCQQEEPLHKSTGPLINNIAAKNNKNSSNNNNGKFKLNHHSSFSCHHNNNRNSKPVVPDSCQQQHHHHVHHHQLHQHHHHHHHSHRTSAPTAAAAAAATANSNQQQQSCKKHHRSRSHDLGFKYQLLLDQDSAQQQPADRPASPNASGKESQKQLILSEPTESSPILTTSPSQQQRLINGCLFTKVTNADAASPHQLKHRNREQEHARAMAQVISWLERDMGIDKKFSLPKIKGEDGSPPPQANTHEHHHVHEHIHHHYHHYAKETIIV